MHFTPFSPTQEVLQQTYTSFRLKQQVLQQTHTSFWLTQQVLNKLTLQTTFTNSIPFPLTKQILQQTRTSFHSHWFNKCYSKLTHHSILTDSTHFTTNSHLNHSHLKGVTINSHFTAFAVTQQGVTNSHYSILSDATRSHKLTLLHSQWCNKESQTHTSPFSVMQQGVTNSLLHSQWLSLTDKDGAELHTVYPEALTKATFPTTGRSFFKHVPNQIKITASWIPHPHNAEHRWKAYDTHCCQETRQRPRGHGDTPCKSGGRMGEAGWGWGSGGQIRKMHIGKCSFICIWRVRRIPEERRNSGCGNRPRWCIQITTFQFTLLIDLLVKHGVSLTLTLWIAGALLERTVIMQLENWSSAPHQLTKGLPQGSLLSPVLYNVYTKGLADLNQNRPRKVLTLAGDGSRYTQEAAKAQWAGLA